VLTSKKLTKPSRLTQSVFCGPEGVDQWEALEAVEKNAMVESKRPDGSAAENRAEKNQNSQIESQQPNSV